MKYELNTTLSLRLGVPDEERATPQDVIITVRFEIDTAEAEKSDDVSDCPINYQDIYDLVHKYSDKEFHLLESLHRSISLDLEASFDLVKIWNVEICKKPWNNGSVKIF